MREQTEEHLDGSFERRARDTAVKSALTGAAATSMVVMLFSPAGLGGFVGTSLASGLGGDNNIALADYPYANLPAVPAPFTDSELSEIHAQLARTAVALELTRTATQARIEQVRAIAESDRASSFARADAVAPTPAQISVAAVGPAVSQPLQLTELEPSLVPVDYAGGAIASGYQGSHQALADLMFAHENF